MTAALTALSFLLLGLEKLGIAVDTTLIAIVLLITAILWLVSAAGVPLPTYRRD